MRLIKSLFVALMVTIMTAIAGSTITHIFDEAKAAPGSLAELIPFWENTAHAQETAIIEVDTQQNANHTITTSLNLNTPSMVIDERKFSSSLNILNQSPQQEEVATSVYEDILVDLVPVSGEDMNYEKILGLTDAQIKAKIENENMTIWDIAAQENETELLENAYYAIYPARIISYLTQKLIEQETADLLIEMAMADIASHQNISVELMIGNMTIPD